MKRKSHWGRRTAAGNCVWWQESWQEGSKLSCVNWGGAIRTLRIFFTFACNRNGLYACLFSSSTAAAAAFKFRSVFCSLARSLSLMSPSAKLRQDEILRNNHAGITSRRSIKLRSSISFFRHFQLLLILSRHVDRNKDITRHYHLWTEFQCISTNSGCNEVLSAKLQHPRENARGCPTYLV